MSIRQNVFPNCWKEALVIPLYKKGDPSLPCNYRPISLLPILSKVFEKILAHQMRNYLENNELIGARQFGFRPGCSTDLLIFQLTNLLKLKMSKKESKYASLAALDTKKAFDCVNHSLLLYKLNNYFLFDKSAYLLLQNYLTCRVQSLKYDSHISSKLPVYTGVPQGSVLGPLLFLIFINDIMDLKTCFLYADDCLVINYGPDSTSAAVSLERDLVNYTQWYKSNLLVLNATKTEVMTISKSQKLKKQKHLPLINFQDLQLKQSDNLKYLGCYIDSNLNFTKHVSMTKRKLHPIIKNFMSNRQFTSQQLAVLWYMIKL